MSSTSRQIAEAVASTFEPEQLTRARELRAMTKTELARRTDMTPAAFTQYEQGASNISPESVMRTAMALGFPLSWFGRKPLSAPLSIDECHFRSLRSVSQYTRRQVLEFGRLVFEVKKLLEDEVDFPQEDVLRLKELVPGTQSMEALARRVREAWGLGLGPIPKMIQLLEAHGVTVLPLATNSADVDAFSAWVEGKPVIFLSMAKSASRTQFDAAHELAHLILHDDVEPGSTEAESEADSFASAFLMPAASILNELPDRWSQTEFRRLKRRWYVSIAALVVKAYKAGKLSKWSYRNAFRTMSQKGWRTNEPEEWEHETPSVLTAAIEVSDHNTSSMAKRLCVFEPYLDALLEQVTRRNGDMERLNVSAEVLKETNFDYRYEY